MTGPTQEDEQGSNRERDRRAQDRSEFHPHLNYAARVVVGFAFISACTAIIVVMIVSAIWNQYFTSYTSANLQQIANGLASQVERSYSAYGYFNREVLSIALASAETSEDIGLMVTSSDGDVIFDSTALPGARDANDLFSSLAPAFARRGATADITVDDEVIGQVSVWVYGTDSTSEMSEADLEFRDDTYSALMLSSALAIVVASAIGFFFAHNLVSPINRVTRTAWEISRGDWGARTGMSGGDEISQLGATMDRMATSIERDRQFERRLTSDVAHELRTPLMAIRATVEAMIDGVYDTDEEHLGVVDVEVGRLSRLVDSLLRLSRMEMRTTPLRLEVLNLGKLVEEVVIAHEVFIVDAGLSVHYHAKPSVMVRADADAVRQAVANLISNAVRYTEEGGSVMIDVYSRTLEEDEGVGVGNGSNGGRAGSGIFGFGGRGGRGRRTSRDYAAIDVTDTGIGLTPEEEEMVFSRLWRSEKSRDREAGGLGIGLALVKEIVERHGGRVLAKGQKGVGSTFTILLPLYEGDTAGGSSTGDTGSKTSSSEKSEGKAEDSRKSDAKSDSSDTSSSNSDSTDD